VRRVTAPTATVAVIGAGASPLVADLASSGCTVIAVDISAAALELLQADNAGNDRIRYQLADVRAVTFDEPIDTWHDRAVLHFLTEPSDQAAYADAAARAVRSGGHLVVATFAPTGPTSCSGLPTARHDAQSLRSLFEPEFDLAECTEHDHVTPWGSAQRFTHAVLRRR
jgi:SAM-dependent methyltransferase